MMLLANVPSQSEIEARLSRLKEGKLRAAYVWYLVSSFFSFIYSHLMVYVPDGIINHLTRTWLMFTYTCTSYVNIPVV